MRWHTFRLALSLVIISWSLAMAAAQDAAPPKTEPDPAKPETAAAQERITQRQAAEQIKEYELSLEQIHSRAANKNTWNVTQSAVWSERQCRTCHSDSHGGERLKGLLLATETVANSLGIEVAPLDGTLRAHLNVDDKSGLVITSAPEGCEGAKLGLKPHDVLLNVDQKAVNEPAKFQELISALHGKKVRFALLRQGKPLHLELAIPQPTLALAITDSRAVLDTELALAQWSDDRYRMGVTLSEADETLRSHLKLAAGEGLVVTEVVEGSPAAKMGVKQNDVLIELDGKRLTTVDAINAQIQELKDKTVLLKLLRSGQEVTCQIAPQKSSEPAQALREWILVGEQAHHPAVVRWFDVRTGKLDVAASDAATQLVELKRQLAEITKTVEKLETVLAPPAEEK